eukprot:497852_1
MHSYILHDTNELYRLQQPNASSHCVSTENDGDPIPIQTKLKEGAYVRIKGLLKVPNFNGKTVKLIAYNEMNGRWKCELLYAKQGEKYLGLTEENLDLILDWEPTPLPNTAPIPNAA